LQLLNLIVFPISRCAYKHKALISLTGLLLIVANASGDSYDVIGNQASSLEATSAEMNTILSPATETCPGKQLVAQPSNEIQADKTCAPLGDMSNVDLTQKQAISRAKKIFLDGLDPKYKTKT
jgi:hypothetical protein